MNYDAGVDSPLHSLILAGANVVFETSDEDNAFHCAARFLAFYPEDELTVIVGVPRDEINAFI